MASQSTVALIPHLLRRRFVLPYAAYKALVCKSSYLHQSGWVESLRRGRPTASSGESLPWMNYSAVDFLKKRLGDRHDLFEFGSGHSTRFYSSLVRSVTSVEYDTGWYENIAADLPNNVELIHQPSDYNGDYCRTIDRTARRYDVIVIDGFDRVNCMLRALECVNETGVIVLDDSDRSEYVPAFQAAGKRGFRTLEFVGMKPTSSKMHATTLFYRDDNCFGI